MRIGLGFRGVLFDPLKLKRIERIILQREPYNIRVQSLEFIEKDLVHSGRLSEEAYNEFRHEVFSERFIGLMNPVYGLKEFFDKLQKGGCVFVLIASGEEAPWQFIQDWFVRWKIDILLRLWASQKEMLKNALSFRQVLVELDLDFYVADNLSFIEEVRAVYGTAGVNPPIFVLFSWPYNNKVLPIDIKVVHSYRMLTQIIYKIQAERLAVQK